MQTRRFIHDENHFDIEALFPIRNDKGIWSDVWVVIWCSEESDNGKVPQAPQDESPANHPSGHIQDLSPVMEMADTTLRKEDNMNGWTPTIPLKERLANLVAEIPQEYRNRAVAECTSDNPHNIERALTAYVMRREWEFYPSPIDEAEVFEDGFCDERITFTGRRYSPKKEAETRAWWNEHYSPENVQKRLAEYRAAADNERS